MMRVMMTDFNPLDIHDNVDIHTHLQFKRKNIMLLNDFVSSSSTQT